MAGQMLEDALFWFRKIGINFNSKRVTLFSFLVCLPAFTIMILMIWDFSTSGNEELDTVLMKLDNFAIQCQAIIRIQLMSINRNLIVSIIQKDNSPFPVSLFNPIQKDLDRKFHLAQTSIKYYKKFLIILTLIYAVSPVIHFKSDIHDIPQRLSFSPWFEILYVWNIVRLVVTVIVYLGTDTMYAFFILNIFLELKKLKYAIEIVDQDDFDQEQFPNHFSKCVEYHVSLRRYAKAVNKIYRPWFLHMIFSTTMILCLNMYKTVFDGTINFSRIFYSSLKAWWCAMEVFIISVLNTKITDEFASIANCAYFCGWWKHYSPLQRKYVLLMMQQAQKPVRFSVFGSVDQDISLFASILKLSFSVYTLLQSMKN